MKHLQLPITYNFATYIPATFRCLVPSCSGDDESCNPMLPETLTLVSLCAGSGTGELAFEAAVGGLSDHFLAPLKPQVLLTCERETWKQAFLQNHVIKQDTCLFNDVQTLGALADRPEITPETAEGAPVSPAKKNAKAAKEFDLTKTPQFCVQHNSHCDPRGKPVFLLKSGFSCKGNSRMNVRFAEFQQSMKQGDLNNSSVSTFYGTLGVIEMMKPRFFPA